MKKLKKIIERIIEKMNIRQSLKETIQENTINTMQQQKEEEIKQENKPKINIPEIEIENEGDVKLFYNEEGIIIEGARQLLELGKAKDMKDAILTYAVMDRGLKFGEIKTTKDGRKVIVFKETIRDEIETSNYKDEDSR